ncbi:hypothetical protein [Streptomyces phaeochromogenes]|uniref:hypothetical protein n=1 Tax=Streptomyces phaeochromogenes TaxID=1923 RepID=UPI00386BCA6C|nr:hypothetical protein OHB08_12955 [Streptomyces phaeochromogenes]
MSRPRVVIVGAGFAGHQTARTLSRPAGAAPDGPASRGPAEQAGPGPDEPAAPGPDKPAAPGPVRPVEGES